MNDNDLLMDKTVLITGCSTGIGRATALRLASDFNVYASARRVESIQDLDGCHKLQLDVTDEDSMVAAVRAIGAPIDVLVNNAGYGLSGAIETFDMDDVRKQFETNVVGLCRLTQLVLPAMRAQRTGKVINLSSVAGRVAFQGMGYYQATKHAVEAISDALRIEVSAWGVFVVLIEPGVIQTEFGANTVRSSGGDYADFHAAAGSALARRFTSRNAAGPDSVARVIERVIRSPNPRARYVITPTGRALVVFRRFAPDWLFDAVLKSAFPRPRP